MRIRTRLFGAFLVLVAVGFYTLIDWIRDDLRPRYLETMEESMVDAATLLSSLVANQVSEETIYADDLRAAFEGARKRRFSAKIYEFTKTRLNMRVYITDNKGIVVFDSDNGRAEGEDYSQWNDVVRTLRGEYGARTTPSDPDDLTSAILYVASPITVGQQIVGVLTVCKPVDSVTLFLETARKKIAFAGLVASVAVVVLGMVISLWISRPIEKLTRYAKAIRDGKRVAPPRLGRSEIGTLGVAFEEMRSALEGKQYVEDYVQTLTHQMKSPVAAIRGAVELLEEDMPPEQRSQFLGNIRSESERIQDLIDRMLQLSALENRNALRDVEDIDLSQLCSDVIAAMNALLSGRRVEVSLASPAPIIVQGERFLIRQAVSNLVQNALDFNEEDELISVSIKERNGEAEINVLDNGAGVPAYALDKVFNRFYSLPRPDTGRKSSGLGLAFVKEVAVLHGGRARLVNRPEGGAKATLILPTKPPPPGF